MTLALKVGGRVKEKGASIEISEYDQHWQEDGLSEKAGEYKERQQMQRDRGAVTEQTGERAEEGKNNKKRVRLAHGN